MLRAEDNTFLERFGDVAGFVGRPRIAAVE
ncbi:hypothetical protein ACVWXO_002786 [Bradyrhizobium sp. LM2.7]